MTETSKRATIVSSFTDEGTGKRYVAGTTRVIAAGAFANYEAAGLVREPDLKQSAAKPAAPAATPTIPAEAAPVSDEQTSA